MNEEKKEQAKNGGVYIDIHDNGDITVNPNLTEMNVTHHHYHNDKPKEVEVVDDPLATFINNNEIYHETVQRLHLCKWPKDINEMVHTYLKNNTEIKTSRLREADVIEMYMPHLVNYKGELKVKNIQSALT